MLDTAFNISKYISVSGMRCMGDKRGNKAYIEESALKLLERLLSLSNDIQLNNKAKIDQISFNILEALRKLNDSSENDLTGVINIISQSDILISLLENSDIHMYKYEFIVKIFGVSHNYIVQTLAKRDQKSQYLINLKDMYYENRFMTSQISNTQNKITESEGIIKIILGNSVQYDRYNENENEIIKFAIAHGIDIYDPFILQSLFVLLTLELNKTWIQDIMQPLVAKYNKIMLKHGYEYISKILNTINNPLELMSGIGYNLYSMIKIRQSDDLLYFPWIPDTNRTDISDTILYNKYIVMHLREILPDYEINESKLSKLRLLNSGIYENHPLHKIVLLQILRETLDTLIDTINSNENAEIDTTVYKNALDKYKNIQGFNKVQLERLDILAKLNVPFNQAKQAIISGDKFSDLVIKLASNNTQLIQQINRK